MLDNATIRFKEPLVLTPIPVSDDPDEPDDTNYMMVEYPELAISSVGTIGELEIAVRADIRYAFRHFVMASDDQLTQATRAVKQNYLAIVEIVSK